MAMNKTSLAAIVAIGATGLVLSVLAVALLSGYQRIPNNGTVKGAGVGVYWDSACTNNVTSIDWSLVQPGSTTTKTVYVKNTGNVNISLSMTTENWSPGTSGNITLSWNRQNYVLTSGSSVQAIFTLTVSSNISGVTSFSFDIVVTGTEQ